MRDRPVPRSEHDLLVRELRELKRQVKLLQNQHAPTMPISPDAPLDPIEGQLAFNGGELQFYLDGSWRPVLGIRFLIDNEGGWLYVATNDSVDLDTLPDPCALGGVWGTALEDASGHGTAIASTTVVRIKSGGEIELDCITSPLSLAVNGKRFEFRDDGTIHIPAGGGVVADL